MEYTNINCTLKCKYQYDGKCTLNTVSIPENPSYNPNCANFKEKT